MVVAFVDAGRRASRAMRRRDAEETDGASRARRDALDAASSLRARVSGSELCAAAASALDRCETTARDRRASVDAVVEACADVVLDFGRHRVVAAACLRRAMVATTVKICEKCARGDRDAETTTRALGDVCELLPHCASACEEFLCSSAVVDPVRRMVARSATMEAEEASACARALETLWRRCPSTRRSFDWSSSIAWLRSESDEVRYNACALVGLAMGLTTRAVWEMRAATTRDARVRDVSHRRVRVLDRGLLVLVLLVDSIVQRCASSERGGETREISGEIERLGASRDG